MNEDFEYTSPEEEAILDLFRTWANQRPKGNMWIAHPTNYPRATKAVAFILDVIHKESPDANHKIVFDELFGTDMSLVIKDWTHSFYGCDEIATAISLADTFDIYATTEGEVMLQFGFTDVRIPIFLKNNDTPQNE